MAAERDASEAPSSSSSDFYNTDAPATEQQTTAIPPPAAADADAEASMARAYSSDLDVPDTNTVTISHDAHADAVADNGANESADDDSGSEMDCSSPSAPPSPGPQPAPDMPVAHIASANNHAGAKRKLSDAVDAAVAVPPASAEDSSKKRKLMLSALPVDAPNSPPRTARLPAEVWQRVFMHLSPAMLCRCLRVCKPFNLYLTQLVAPPPSRPSRRDQTKARIMDSESIWIHSRKIQYTTMPRPLAAFSELDMLKLVGGRTCHFCARTPVPVPATSLFNAGPGANGVRVIWPFGIRACGPCLELRILKDIQVLSDPSLSQLRLGVPYGFRSPELHFVTDSVRQMPGGIPGNLRFAKVYYIPDLEAIKAEEENAKTLGEGAADEWRKGLAAQGKDAMADCARWEKWELNMRPGADLSQVLRECDMTSFPHYFGQTHGRSAGVNGTQVQPSVVANGTHPLPQPVHVFHNVHNAYGAQYQQPMPQYQQPVPQHQQQHVPQHQHPFPQHHRPARNPQEVEEARQARKADIERRCRELEPPVEPNVLQHMESFQAAMQITTPMTDASWNMLKPRILDQRERAEYVEHERASQLAALQAAMPSSMLEDYLPKPAKETYDREYEQTQDPLRKRLGEYATDCINGQWGGGRMLERDNSPIFAAQVLLHVYKRYTEDKQLGLLPKLETNTRKPQAKQGSPAPEPFLSLDNMKWVYDNKVRPLTDPLRREQFLCAGCTEEKKPKWFAFEGLIQHYGAKHTSAFSRGNIVVHWQTSDWPEEAPFHTNPGQWLKLDRRVPSHNRPRHATQGNNDSSLMVPTPKSHESVHYATSDGYQQNGGHGYQALQYSQSASNGHHQPAEEATEKEPDQNYDQQVDKLSKDAREAWDAMEGVKDLLECVRVHTSLQNGVRRFNETYRQKPTLDMLSEAVTTNALTRPLKNAHGLACKSCVAAPANGAPVHGSYWTRIRSAKLYNTSSLVTHFKLMHQAQDFGQLDWTTEMIELPDNDMIKDLLRTPGMDDSKLALVAAAFPGVFSLPLPLIGVVSGQPETTNGAVSASRLLNRVGKKQKSQSQPKKKGQKKAYDSSVDRDTSQDPLPEPTEDEYDPRRPMFVPNQSSSFDPAQFDTDARKSVDVARFDTDARKPHQASALPAASTNTFGLAPETLAALQSLTGIQSVSGKTYSRSPSVGRSAPQIDFRAAPAPPTANTAGQPDIAAILASLTGQAPAAQHATPPTANLDRAGSAVMQPYPDVYARPSFDEARRPVSRYGGAYQSLPDAAASRGVPDLQAVISSNNRQFEQNQHHTYMDPSQAPAAHPAPRYQYIHESDQNYGQPPARAPMYREAPIHYVQRPDSEHIPAGYQYERPAPQPIYVDQYGRPLELVPIDSNPPQVPYGLNPYEQQQYGRRAEQPVYTTVGPGAHIPVHDGRYEHRTHHSGWDDNARASVPRS